MSDSNSKNSPSTSTIKLDCPDLSQIFYDSKGKIIQQLGSVNDTYVCSRPSSHESIPCIKEETAFPTKTKKRIISNYGQHGLGWTINWSSVLKSFTLFDINELITSDTKIAIIGCGIIGLSTASLLIERGVQPSNISIFTDSLNMQRTASYGSGALFSAIVTDPNARKDLDELVLNNYKAWFDIFNLKNQKPSIISNSKSKLKLNWENLLDHFRYIDFYSGSSKEEGFVGSSGVEVIVEAGLLPKPELVNIQFPSGKTHTVNKYKTFYFNTPDLLRNLTINLIEAGVTMEKRKITDIDSQIKESFIFNCSGSGCQNVDPYFKNKAYPVAGHMLHLKVTQKNKNYSNSNSNNAYIDLDYVLLSMFKKNKNSEEELFIYMPKKGPGFDFVLGGSKIKDYWGDNDELNKKYFNQIIETAKIIYGEDNLNTKKNNLPKF